MGTERFFLFEDATLRHALEGLLLEIQLPHRIDESHRLWYNGNNQEKFDDAVCKVRNQWAQGKPWHLVSWDEPPDTLRYREILIEQHIPFAAEQTCDLVWFLLRNEDQPACDAAAAQIWTKDTTRGDG